MGGSRRQTIAGNRIRKGGRSSSNNKSPTNRARGNSQINQGALGNLREVDDDIDEERYDDEQMEMMNNIHSRQINVKSFELNTSGGSQPFGGSKSTMV